MTVEQKLILIDKLISQYRNYGSTHIHDCIVETARQLMREKITYELPKEIKYDDKL